MEEQERDRRAEELGIVLSRRSVLKGAAGIGAAVVGGFAIGQHADAARRGYSGPEVPSTSGDGLMWWVDVQYSSRRTGLQYRIRQVAGDPFEVSFGNQTPNELIFDIDNTYSAFYTLPGY